MTAQSKVEAYSRCADRVNDDHGRTVREVAFVERFSELRKVASTKFTRQASSMSRLLDHSDSKIHSSQAEFFLLSPRLCLYNSELPIAIVVRVLRNLKSR